jgi:hypothetical protein
VRIARRRRCRSKGSVDGQSSHHQELTHSRGSQRRHRLEPPEGGSRWLRSRSCGRSVRAADPTEVGGGGLVGTSRSGRLQGLAPLTSPLRHVAVASDSTLVSSMGFVVPSKVPCNPHHPGDASTGESLAVEPELGLGGPVPESPRQAVEAGADGIPSVVYSLTRCRSRRGETAARGGRSRIQALRLFSGAVEPFAAPGSRRGRSRGGGSGRCHRSLSGKHGREERIRDASRGRPPPGGGVVASESPAGLVTDLHGVFQRQRPLRGASPRLAPVGFCPSRVYWPAA